MNLTKSLVAVLTLAVLLSVSSCSQGSSGGGDTEDENGETYTLVEGTLLAATPESVIGTWTEETSKDDNQFKAITTWTFDSEGNYQSILTLIISYSGTPKYSWTGEAGTVSFSDGVATFTMTSEGKSSSEDYDPTTAVWTPAPVRMVRTINAVIIDGKLCLRALKRVGTGSGIEGTWEQYQSQVYPSLSDIDQYTKETYVFTGSVYTDTEITSKSPAFDPIASSSELTCKFTVGKNNVIEGRVTGTSSVGMDVDYKYKSHINISGDWLYFGPGAAKTN